MTADCAGDSQEFEGIWSMHGWLEVLRSTAEAAANCTRSYIPRQQAKEINSFDLRRTNCSMIVASAKASPSSLYTTLYRPLGPALFSPSIAATRPSLSSLVNSLIAFSTITSVSPSTRMYSFGCCPGSGSTPFG